MRLESIQLPIPFQTAYLRETDNKDIEQLNCMLKEISMRNQKTILRTDSEGLTGGARSCVPAALILFKLRRRFL